MIKTSRSRLEIRQDPDRTAALAGALLVAAAGTDAVLCLAAVVSAWGGGGAAVPALRLLVSASLAAAGWLFLRGRSRVVIDLEHRMVARYMGVGGAGGANRTWDLDEFAAVVLVPRAAGRPEAVRLRPARGDGDLEIHRGPGAAALAARVAEFSGLPYLGRGAA